MSEEEKKAIEILKEGVGIGDFITCDWVKTEIATKTILNLIEKQQTRIEELEEEIKEFEIVINAHIKLNEQFKDDYISKQKKKIKYKIEELKEIKYEEAQVGEIEDLVNGIMIRATKRYDYEVAKFVIMGLEELLEEDK